jgi:hypothetical protein
MQWYATGSVNTNARRPDHRCARPIQRGLDHGSLRKIQAALKSWTHARTTAAVAKPALRCTGSLKNSRK